MGCGLISQRGPSVEVHHPIALDPGRRAAGARVVENGVDVRTGLASTVTSGGASPQGSLELRGLAATGPDVRTTSIAGASGSAGTEGRVAHGGPAARGAAGRRFIMGERVALASRMPSYAQDHAFCFECGSFFQLANNPNVPACTRCDSSFVQFLRPPGGEHWIRSDSQTGVNFSFDDQLDNSLTASFDEAPLTKRPIQAATLHGLPTQQLTEVEVQARKNLDPKDPRCHCAICRESFCTVYAVKRLPCSHEFHDTCITPWLQGNSSCPICRFRLPEAAEGEEVEEDSEENLQCLKRPSSDTAVVGVPTSAAAAGTPVGAGADGVAQGSGGSGLDVSNSTAVTAVVRCPSPQVPGTASG